MIWPVTYQTFGEVDCNLYGKAPMVSLYKEWGAILEEYDNIGTYA